MPLVCDIKLIQSTGCMCPKATRLEQFQEGVTTMASVLSSVTSVKIKVDSQLEIFFKVNGQATIITLIYTIKLLISAIKSNSYCIIQCSTIQYKIFWSKLVKHFDRGHTW